MQKEGFAFAAASFAEQEALIPRGWLSVCLLSPELKSITSMYEE